jgi:hypothetical protein
MFDLHTFAVDHHHYNDKKNYESKFPLKIHHFPASFPNSD